MAAGSAVALLTALALVACSSRGSASTLQERVSKYWELKQAKQWGEVYDDFLDPTLKAKLSKDAFLHKRRLSFDVLSFKVAQAKEDGDRATVTVTNEANFPVIAPGGAVHQTVRKTVTTEDEWVRRDGVWYVQLAE